MVQEGREGADRKEGKQEQKEKKEKKETKSMKNCGMKQEHMTIVTAHQGRKLTLFILPIVKKKIIRISKNQLGKMASWMAKKLGEK